MPKHSRAKKRGKGPNPRGRQGSPELFCLPHASTPSSPMQEKRRRRPWAVVALGLAAALVALAVLVATPLSSTPLGNKVHNAIAQPVRALGNSISSSIAADEADGLDDVASNADGDETGDAGANGTSGTAKSKDEESSASSIRSKEDPSKDGDTFEKIASGDQYSGTKASGNKAAQEQGQPAPGPLPTEPTTSMMNELTNDSYKTISSNEQIAGISLDERRSTPLLSKKDNKAIQSAIDAIRDNQADCGFLFVDMDSGKGVAFNIDYQVYCASTVKAPFALYVIQSKPEGLDDNLRSDIEAALVYSDNDAYEELHAAVDDNQYLAWLDERGIGHSDSWGPHYPSLSVRQLAGLWTEIHHYLHADQQESAWLAELLTRTTTSFIRDGLGVDGLTVYNKAGWISDEECGNAVNDVAIIQEDDHTYLMAIASSQPDTEESHENVSALANALFAARANLNQ